MGNCNACVRVDDVADSNRGKNKNNKKTKPNPYAEEEIRSGVPIRVLKDVTSRSLIGDKYVIGRELGRGEFGITYLCTDRETKQELACKSISKRKLRTAIDRGTIAGAAPNAFAWRLIWDTRPWGRSAMTPTTSWVASWTR